MEAILKNNRLILMEGAIIEQLRRSDSISLDPLLVNAPLIYDEIGKEALKSLYQGYIDIAVRGGLPFLMCTPTWRTNIDRIGRANARASINGDAVRFMHNLRLSQGSESHRIKIGGLVGCKNDCYKPEEGLSVQEAEEFHSWQVHELAGAGVDFLIAQTLPAVQEALGIAKAMERSGLPYFISFVISRDGRVLDGTHLGEAFGTIDAHTVQNPLGYMVNCAFPSFLCAQKQPGRLFTRLVGYLANASSLDHKELDGALHLQGERVSDWGDLMLDLNQTHGVKILGGCCGTNPDHLAYLAGT